MGRVLGKVEFGNGEPDRFFIHCNTSGWSSPTLFADPAEAWRVYDEGRDGALRNSTGQSSTIVHAIRKVLSDSVSFLGTGKILGNPMYGLATTDRLLIPLSDSCEEPNYSLLDVDGVLHVARDADGGFDGVYEVPLCADRWTWSAEHTRVGFESKVGRSMNLCPKCVAVLLGKGKST